MRANEAPKSKFVYPDKLYARTNNITLDISYAPQTLEAVEYTRTDAVIEWIKEMWSETDDRFKQDYTGMLIEHFKKYTKGK